VSAFEWLGDFTWQPGACFRCEAAGLQVTCVGVMEGEAGPVGLFSCKSCWLRLVGHYVATAADGTSLPTGPSLHGPQ